MVQQLSLYEDETGPDAPSSQATAEPCLWSSPDYEFPTPEVDIDLMYRIRQEWHDKLRALRFGKGTPDYPSESQIAEFTEFLVKNQRNDTGPSFKAGSWALSQDTRMPADARVDFAYMPTYVAVAWLSLVKVEHPRAIRGISDFRPALRAGLDFASGRNLRGSGFDAEKELLHAIRILALGKVFTSMREERVGSSTFRRAVARAEASLVAGLPVTDWSGTPAAEQRLALSLIQGGDTDDALVSEPVWPVRV